MLNKLIRNIKSLYCSKTAEQLLKENVELKLQKAEERLAGLDEAQTKAIEAELQRVQDELAYVKKQHQLRLLQIDKNRKDVEAELRLVVGECNVELGE